MKTTVRITANFSKEAKPLLKKYHSLKADLSNLEKDLLGNPKLGTPLGNNTFKIRIKITSKGKGKSGGARVITYVETELIATIKYTDTETTVYLVSIYDKSDAENISNKELTRLIELLKQNH